MTDLDVTIILFIGSIMAAFIAGIRYAEYRFIKRMLDMMTPDELDELDELAEKIKADLSSKGIKDVKVHQVDAEDVVEVKHERIDGKHFFYEDGDKFLCQGASFEEVSRTLAELIGTKKVGVINHEDGGTSLVIDGKLRGGGEVK